MKFLALLYALAGASLVTSDAKRSVSGAKRADLVMNSIVRGLLDFAESRGVVRADFLSRIGLEPSDLEDQDGFVPLEAYARAWEFLDAQAGHEELGLALVGAASLHALGALGYAMVHAESALAALLLFRRHRRLMSDSLAPEIDVDDSQVVFHLVWPARFARITALADQALAGPIHVMRALTKLPESVPLALEAWYQGPRPAGMDRAQALGCKVRYGAPEMRLVLRREPLEAALPRHDPELFRYLSRHTEAIAARVPQTAPTRDLVRRALVESLRQGEPIQADVGRKLGLSERTLQRRLRDEDTTFAAILDDLRRELAQLYLASPDVSLHEVAFLLGYSEPSAFHRAFRRWTGLTPQAFRRSGALREPAG
ncbi:MAG: AraC family transcriptional regulator ligand-binding domain-containing protein [Myxococcales bacterium]